MFSLSLKMSLFDKIFQVQFNLTTRLTFANYIIIFLYPRPKTIVRTKPYTCLEKKKHKAIKSWLIDNNFCAAQNKLPRPWYRHQFIWIVKKPWLLEMVILDILGKFPIWRLKMAAKLVSKSKQDENYDKSNELDR